MNVLKYGVVGYPVTLLQYALSRTGLDAGNPDGIFGRRTAKALQQFQRAQGLAADGVAGKLTWAALYPLISGYTLHRIAPGDTFFKLAQRYGSSINAIRTANPAFDPEALPVGETLIVPRSQPVVTAQIPCSSMVSGLMVKGLVMRYPFLKVREIGRSVMGRPLLALSVGSGQRQVGCNAAHHADEWIAALALLRFFEEYAASYAAGEPLGGVPARELYESVTLHAVPLVNPDGIDLVSGALDPSDSFYVQAEALSAHYPNIPFPEGWRSNISGIDLDLQYPTGWEKERRVRVSQGCTRPGPRGYVGSEPLIAPESRAVAQWTKAHDFSWVLSCRVGPADRDGFTAWFSDTWRRPGKIVETGTGESTLAKFEEAYRETRPVLTHGLTISP